MANDNDEELRRYIRNLEEQFNTSEQEEMQRDYDRRRQREMQIVEKSVSMNKSEAENYIRNLEEEYSNKLYYNKFGENFWFPKKETKNKDLKENGESTKLVMGENCQLIAIAEEKSEPITEESKDHFYEGKKYKINKTLKDQYVDIIMSDDTIKIAEETPPKKNKMKEFMKNVLDKFKNKGKSGYKILKYYFVYGIVKILTFIGIYDINDKKETVS